MVRRSARPAPLARWSDAVLRQQMRTAREGTIEHLVGPGVPIQPQETQDGAGASPDHVQVDVRLDQLVAEQPGEIQRFGEEFSSPRRRDRAARP